MLTSCKVDLVRAGQASNHLLGSLIYSIIYFMMSIVDTKKGPGRPRVDSEAVMVRMPAEMLKALDHHIKKSRESISRPEAIRRLVELGLRGKR
jgi:hypothetical protein